MKLSFEDINHLTDQEFSKEEISTIEGFKHNLLSQSDQNTIIKHTMEDLERSIFESQVRAEMRGGPAADHRIWPGAYRDMLRYISRLENLKKKYPWVMK